ncbi:MAG: polysaccharide biosynthesis/export family protein, partial [Acidobacteriota bacterium]
MAYLLRAGDELEIRGYNLPELTQAVRIRPDGRISLLLLGDVEAAGRGAEQLGEVLSSLYAKHFRNPRITVIVRSFSNFHVYVGGEVMRPGLIPLGGEVTVASAIFHAGGFKEEEGPKRVMLLRHGDGKGPDVITLDLNEVLTQGKPDVVLRPADVLYVPRAAINVYVGGEVDGPGLIPLYGRMTALSAILRARGFKPTAKMDSVILIRDSGQ